MALINKLEAIGDAVRAKTGDTNKLTLDEMATKINGIKPGPTTSDLTITGNCKYRFANGGWDWVIEKYGNQITTHDITNIDGMFSYSNVDRIPFSINLSNNKSNGFHMDKVFYGCYNLTELPYIENAVPTTIQYFSSINHSMQQIPENYFDNWNWNIMKNMTGQFEGYADYLFSNCTKLRKLPLAWLANMNPKIYYSYSYFYGGFGQCEVLDELLELPIPYTGVWTGSAFRGFCENTYRIKNITFAPTGAKKWKNQEIDLSYRKGYGSANIGKDKRVVDDATYAALKNDPDWWTEDVLYSRYNHDSAVATINSLPDTSEYLATSGGTNTIKFKGAAGEKTDGGAINTLTAEEIAVAAAKGWTVTLV